jgi:hypothetical protein
VLINLIITKSIEVSWAPNNVKHYEQLGYVFVKKGIKFIIPIEHLPVKASNQIEIKCDYCLRHFFRPYKDHTSISEKDLLITKDACSDCRFEKSKEITLKKQELGLLNPSDNSYWKFKQNRLKELLGYIKKHGTLNNLYSSNDGGRTIWSNFRRNNHSIEEAIVELGYTREGLLLSLPYAHYYDLNKLSEKIQTYINMLGKFPTQQEMINELGIHQGVIQKHGGIYEVKRKMNYNDQDDLCDDNGFYNRSSYEYIVAQFLIHNTDIQYKREQSPFPKHENGYLSDFSFTVESGETVFVEVWGFYGGTKRNTIYQNIKKDKKLLYEKYNLKLIEINKALFQRKMDSIQEELSRAFSPYSNMKFEKVDSNLLVQPTKLTDEELLGEILSFSNDKEILPNSSYLKKIGKYCLYDVASKRYGSYHNFGLAFNKSTTKKNQGFWNPSSALDQTLQHLRSGGSLDRKELMECGLGSLISIIEKHYDGMISFRLFLYLNYPDLLEKIHPSELKIINQMANNKGTNIRNRITPEQQERANLVIEHFKSKNT